MSINTIKQKILEPNGLTRPEALTLARDFVENGNVYFTAHALTRSRERRISMNDIWKSLRSIESVTKKISIEEEKEYSYQITGKNGYQFAIYFKEDHMLIVTCMLPQNQYMKIKEDKNEYQTV